MGSIDVAEINSDEPPRKKRRTTEQEEERVTHEEDQHLNSAQYDREPTPPNEAKQSVYSTLDTGRKEIRIVVVEPGTEHEIVRGSFRQAFLDGEIKPCYETISYVWGDATRNATIILEGRGFKVPTSSERVIRGLRLRDRPRALWLDAVCINQEDKKDKSAQVSIMGEIYSNGSTNHVWLGEEHDTTEDAIAVMKAMHDELIAETGTGEAYFDAAYGSGELAYLNRDTSLTLDASAVDNLFETSPWFTRLWICQEATLSPVNVCHLGTKEFPLQYLLRCSLWSALHIRGIDGLSSNKVSQVLWLAEWADPDFGYNRLRLSNKSVLLNLLNSFRSFQAQDPRDHYFALIGLLQEFSGKRGLPQALRADYDKSLSEVLQDATRFTIHDRADLKALRYVCHSREEYAMPDLASWVPRWDNPVDGLHDAQPFFRVGQCADAGRALDVELALCDPNLLTVRGFILGTVEELSGSPGVANTVCWTISLCNVCEEMVRKLDPKINLSVEEVVGHALTAGVTTSRQPKLPSTSGKHYAAYKAQLEQLDSAREQYFDQTRFEDRAFEEYNLSMAYATLGRRFFRSGQDFFGLGPDTTQVGDVLTIVFGADFPIVLRPVVSTAGMYECVGEAYVHGIMYGEAVGLPGQEEKIFRIR